MLERSADELLKQGREYEARIIQLQAEKLREKVYCEIPACPKCKLDLGTNEDCRVCFDSHNENAGICFACGEAEGTNVDCFECGDYSRERAEMWRDIESGR